jgi:SAM-dependent methyltransferase
MDPIAEHEKKKYQALWEFLPDYREDSPGQLFIAHFLNFFSSELKERDSIVDFGCGSGKVVKYFIENGLITTLVDFCSNCLDNDIALLTRLCPEQVRFIEGCLWDLPDDLGPSDWIYCCDVLEHIPPTHIDAVLAGMSDRTKKGGYISISLTQDWIGEKVIGTPLHLTVKDRRWWEEKLSVYWDIVYVVSGFDGLYFNCCVLPRSKSQ